METGWQYLDALCARLGGDWVPFTYPSAGVIALDNTGLVDVGFSVEMLDGKPFIWTHGLYSTDNGNVSAGIDALGGGLLFKLDEFGGRGQGTKDYALIGAYFGRDGVSGGPRALPKPVVLNQSGGRGAFSGRLQNLTGAGINVRLNFIGLKRR